jgi:hypothetical protein
MVLAEAGLKGPQSRILYNVQLKVTRKYPMELNGTVVDGTTRVLLLHFK